MRLGYNWRYGPFELLDRLGTAWFAERLGSEGREVPAAIAGHEELPFYKDEGPRRCFRGCSAAYQAVQRPAGVLLLGDIKRGRKAVMANRSASLWDIGERVALLEFHSKMNSINPFTLSLIKRSVAALPGLGFKALVLHNEAKNFSVGANLIMLLMAVKLHLWPLVDRILLAGQRAFGALKYAPFPVVGAPSGMALGGGCEVLLHCDALVAHAETYMGLVESGVGIVPGWGGCKELLGRWQSAPGGAKGPLAPARKTFEVIAPAKVGRSAHDCRRLGFLRATDEIVMGRERLLARAKERALEMAPNYHPPEPYRFRLAGESGREGLRLGVRALANKGEISTHDELVAMTLARVLTGGDADPSHELTEKDILALERRALIDLIKTKKSKERIVHILKYGKPLRN